LIVAIPQGFQKRRIIELAREANPDIDTAARTYRASEVAYLKAQGVGLAIMGEREVGFGLLQYALCSLGVANESAAAIVLRERALGEGGAFDREDDVELPEPTPELRKRANDEGH
jgi:CPA2 family monovalent cation:H+ antiporter-2